MDQKPMDFGDAWEVVERARRLLQSQTDVYKGHPAGPPPTATMDNAALGWHTFGLSTAKIMLEGGFIRTAERTLPWVTIYAVIYFVARGLGPWMFSACAKLDPPKLSLWAAYVNSMVNAFVITPLAFQTGFHAAGTGFAESNPLSMNCCYAFLGYTGWDTIVMLWHRNDWPNMGMYYCHHAASILGWGMNAVTGYGHNIGIPALLFEATGPFTNGRWFLSLHGMKDTTLYLVNGIMMLVSFFALRVCFNIWLLYDRFWVQQEEFRSLPEWMQWLLLILFFINLALQLSWFQKIVSGALALLFPGKGKKDAKATAKKKK
jgi:hypothetical protein